MQDYPHHLRKFLLCETGAVTVDWVVLAAASVGLGIASVGAVRMGTNDLGAGIGASLSDAVVARITLLSNGSFDPTGMIWWTDPNGVASHWYSNSGVIPGWTLADPTNRIDILPSTRYPWLAAAMPNGGNVLELVGQPGSLLDIRQSVALPPGQTARVTFDAGAHSNVGMNVWWGDTLLQSFDTMPQNQLKSYSFDVVAGEADQNFLRFEATKGAGWNGALIANVEVK